MAMAPPRLPCQRDRPGQRYWQGRVSRTACHVDFEHVNKVLGLRMVLLVRDADHHLVYKRPGENISAPLYLGIGIEGRQGTSCLPPPPLPSTQYFKKGPESEKRSPAPSIFQINLLKYSLPKSLISHRGDNYIILLVINSLQGYSFMAWLCILP